MQKCLMYQNNIHYLLFKVQKQLKQCSRLQKLIYQLYEVGASPSGLVNVRGGKWTTYRKMAEDTVRFFKKECGLEFEPADTAVLALDMTNTQPRGMHPKDESELASAVTLAVEEEMCMTTEDFLARRYRTLFLDAKNARSSAVLVSELLSQNHGLNAEWAQRQSLDFQNLAQHYLPTP